MCDYEIGIIGAGAAAMYYLDARMGTPLTKRVQQGLEKQLEAEPGALARTAVDLKDTILIGADNPWHIRPEARHTGRGPRYFVNHSRQVISTRPLSELSDTLDRETGERRWRLNFWLELDWWFNEDLFQQSTGYTPREAFAEEWLDVIGRATAQGLTREWAYVTRIDKPTPDADHFTLTYSLGESEAVKQVKVRRLILAMGAGGWTKPTGVASHDRILNLDEYMLKVVDGSTPLQHVVCIQGANAAIDGVEQALRMQHRVHWLTRSSPRILRSTLLEHAPKMTDLLTKAGGKNATYVPAGSARESKIYGGIQQVRVHASNDGVTVQGCRTAPKSGEDNFTLDVEITADYYVYCIGQDATASSIGATRLLIDSGLLTSQDGKIPESEWEPYLDEGWYFRQLSHRRGALEEAAIGLRKRYPRDSGQPNAGYLRAELHVFGASSFMLLPRGGKLAEKLKAIVNYQVPSVADERQLGAIKDIMRAYVDSISGASLDPENVNFLGGTKNDLAAYIAMHHGDIPAIVADDLVDFLLMVRGRPEYTNGYTRTERHAIRRALADIEALFQSASPEVLTFFKKEAWLVRSLMVAPFREVSGNSKLAWDDVQQDFIARGGRL